MDSVDEFGTIHVDSDACPLQSSTHVDKAVWDAAR
jgi:hypothetical protein